MCAQLTHNGDRGDIHVQLRTGGGSVPLKARTSAASGPRGRVPSVHSV